MATLEDIEVYESLSFASVVSYDLDTLETIQSIQDDYRIVGAIPLSILYYIIYQYSLTIKLII